MEEGGDESKPHYAYVVVLFLNSERLQKSWSLVMAALHIQRIEFITEL